MHYDLPAGVPFGFSSMIVRHNVDTIVADDFNMLTDHPQVFREIHTQYHPLPTHPGGLSLVSGLGPGLDEHPQT